MACTSLHMWPLSLSSFFRVLRALQPLFRMHMNHSLCCVAPQGRHTQLMSQLTEARQRYAEVKSKAAELQTVVRQRVKERYNMDRSVSHLVQSQPVPDADEEGKKDVLYGVT